MRFPWKPRIETDIELIKLRLGIETQEVLEAKTRVNLATVSDDVHDLQESQFGHFNLVEAQRKEYLLRLEALEERLGRLFPRPADKGQRPTMLQGKVMCPGCKHEYDLQEDCHVGTATTATILCSDCGHQMEVTATILGANGHAG